MRNILAPFLVILTLLSASCAREEKVKDQSSTSRLLKAFQKPVPVTALIINPKIVPLVVATSGKTEAKDRFQAKAHSAMKVQKVLVEEGAKVEAGAALVKFDDEILKLRSAKVKAELQEAEAALANDRYLEANKDQLITDGKVTTTEAGGLDFRVKLHEATIERAKAEIELFEKDTDEVQINSPIPGVVTHKEISDGATVVEDQPLLEVVRLDPILFAFRVPADSLAALEKSPVISVKFQVIPDREFTGEIASVGSEAKAEAGGVEIKVNIPNPDFLLKAETRGDVTIRTQAKKKILTVPETAILKTERSNYVFKLEDNKAKKIPVDLGERLNGQVIVTKGIAESDMIVEAPSQDLQDGSPVDLQTTHAEK